MHRALIYNFVSRGEYISYIYIKVGLNGGNALDKVKAWVKDNFHPENVDVTTYVSR